LRIWDNLANITWKHTNLQLILPRNLHGMHMWSLNILSKLTWSQIHLWFLLPVVFMLTHVPWPQSSSDVELIQSSERCMQWTPYQPLVQIHLATKQKISENREFTHTKKGLHMMNYSADSTNSLHIYDNHQNSQELSSSPSPEPDQSSPHHLILSLQNPSSHYPYISISAFLAVSFPLAFQTMTYTYSSSHKFVLLALPTSSSSIDHPNYTLHSIKSTKLLTE
jgi:hypothetical protein